MAGEVGSGFVTRDGLDRLKHCLGLRFKIAPRPGQDRVRVTHKAAWPPPSSSGFSPSLMIWQRRRGLLWSQKRGSGTVATVS